jgi:hypothetical protein
VVVTLNVPRKSKRPPQIVDEADLPMLGANGWRPGCPPGRTGPGPGRTTRRATPRPRPGASEGIRPRWAAVAPGRAGAPRRLPPHRRRIGRAIAAGNGAASGRTCWSGAAQSQRNRGSAG